MGHELLILGTLLIIAVALGRGARRIGLPTIPVYMLVGLLASPTTALPLSIPHDQLELVAAFGLILLLFDLGLEFDFEDFVGNARSLVLAGGTYILINFGSGFGFGMLLGWGWREALVIAGVMGASSTAIVTKLLIDLGRLTNEETPMILGVIVVEDLFLALYLAVLGGVLGEPAPILETALDLLVSFVFLVALFALARYGGRWIGRLIHTADPELFTVTFFGLVILIGGAADELGVSGAIGAFLIGVVLAGTQLRERIVEFTIPLRDVFAVFFFLAFGVSLDPSTFGSVALPALAAVAITVTMNLAAGQLSARLHHFGASAGLTAGLTLLSRGEFALILATLAVGAGLDARVSPFAGLYVLILALIGPILSAKAPRLTQMLRRRRRARRPPRSVDDDADPVAIAP
jgi:monovalent cation:H+ antiporter-2, CPA2 family